MKYHLAEYNFSVRGIHFPKEKQEFYQARERLVFEEFLVFILSLRQMKEKKERSRNQFPDSSVRRDRSVFEKASL